MNPSLRLRLAIFPAVTLLSFAAVCRLSNAAEPTAWTPELMMKVKNVGSVVPSPDGNRVAYVVTEAVMDSERSEFVSQIFLANSHGTETLQLTHAEKSSDNPQWSPDGKSIAFTSARSGTNNIWLIAAAGGEAHRLTDSKTDVGSFKWSPLGAMIAYIAIDPPTAEEETAAKEKTDARVVDGNLKLNRLYYVSVASDADGHRSSRLVTLGDCNVGVDLATGDYDWSPDEKNIVFTRARAPDWREFPSQGISVVDILSGDIKALTDAQSPAFSPLYSPDGHSIVCLLSRNIWGSDGLDVAILPAAGGSLRKLAKTADLTPTLVGWSRDGERIYCTERDRTVTRLYALPVNGSAAEKMNQRDSILSTVTLNASRTMIGFQAQSQARPPEAFISRLDRFTPVLISHVNESLSSVPTGRTEVIHWRSLDGAEVEGLLTYPVKYRPGNRYPLVTLVHAGGEAYAATFLPSPFESSASFFGAAVFAAHGYAVLRCNCRGGGMPGYGLAYGRPEFEPKEKAYPDLMTGIDKVIAMGVADNARLGIMGHSNGGMMTIWAVLHSQRFKAASVAAAFPDFIGHSLHNPFMAYTLGGEFWDKLPIYYEKSPLFKVKGVVTPMLILHGEADTSVKISQAYDFYHTLKRQGSPVKLVVYPRTDHDPKEPKLILDYMRRNVEWMDKYVRVVGP